MDSCHSPKIFRTSTGKIVEYCYKTGLRAAKTVSKKVVHKAAAATREFLENKIAEEIVKPKQV